MSSGEMEEVFRDEAERLETLRGVLVRRYVLEDLCEELGREGGHVFA